MKQDRERSYRSFAMCMDDRIESSRICENSKMRRLVPNIIITALVRLLPSKLSCLGVRRLSGSPAARLKFRLKMRVSCLGTDSGRRSQLLAGLVLGRPSKPASESRVACRPCYGLISDRPMARVDPGLVSGRPTGLVSGRAFQFDPWASLSLFAQT